MFPSLCPPPILKTPSNHLRKLAIITPIIPNSTIKAPSPPSPLQNLTRFTLPSLLKLFASHQDLANGQKAHVILLQMGFQSDPFVASSLINLYFKCHSPIHAHNVFAQLPQRDATLWNSMVAGSFHVGRPHQALVFLREMQSSGFVRPDAYLFTILLKACSDHLLKLEHGEQVHAYIVRNYHQLVSNDPYLVTALIDMYSKCGDVLMACRVFDGSESRTVSMWNAMISGFCRSGLSEKSLKLFVLMRNQGYKVESSTISSVLVACSNGVENVVHDFGEGVHCFVVMMGFDSDSFVSTSLVGMYGKFGLIDEARKVFYGVLLSLDRRIELWNSMVSACVCSARPDEAFSIYKQMRFKGVSPDPVTVTNLLSACISDRQWKIGRTIHGELIKRPDLVNTTVQSSLIAMYMKSGSVENAVSLFASIKEQDRDLVTWGSMIVGFYHNQCFHQSLCLFNQLRTEGLLSPDAAIIATITLACTSLECRQLGHQIHGLAIKSGVISDQFVGSTLIDMYSKLGSPQLARSLLSAMPFKNLVIFNSMISGYARNDLVDESIDVFSEISRHSLVPDSISIMSVLVSVSTCAALLKGKMIHGYQVRNGIGIYDISVENALLDMYMKCGSLSYAQRIFERMPTRDVVSWNTVIAGYGSHGRCTKAITLFEEMEKGSEILPDHTTFLSLLSACSHSGLVEQGLRFFDTMRTSYGIVPRMEHYAVMVDLLARAGRLSEAYNFIKSMPVEPDESIWLCLLSACRAHRSFEIGEEAAEQLLKLKPRGSGNYSQVLNLYGEMGLVEKAANVRMEMKRVGMMKNPGCSWIEVKDRVEMFYSGDLSSPLSVDIHDMLSGMRRIMRDVDEVSECRERSTYHVLNSDKKNSTNYCVICMTKIHHFSPT